MADTSSIDSKGMVEPGGLNTTILKQWNATLDAISDKKFYSLINAGDSQDIFVIRHIFELFCLVKYSFKRDEIEAYNEFIKALESNNCKSCIKSFDFLDEWLYNKGITRFDTKKEYKRG